MTASRFCVARRATAAVTAGEMRRATRKAQFPRNFVATRRSERGLPLRRDRPKLDALTFKCGVGLVTAKVACSPRLSTPNREISDTENSIVGIRTTGLWRLMQPPTGACWLIRKFLPPSDRHRRRRRRRRFRREASLIVTFGYNARRNKFVAGAVHN